VSPPSQSREWDVVLRDGSTLHIRPYVPADAAAVRAFLHGLSPETIFLRFFGMASPESFDMSGLDSSQPANRYTMLADVRGRVLALATYVRSETRRDEAEAAFVIADRLQGRGLGTRLLELLAGVARAEDIGVFTAHVLGQNARMREVFRESGFPIEVTPEDGGFRVALDLKTAAYYEERGRRLPLR
jgi:GNAT superfamily N-acetyltransferase